MIINDYQFLLSFCCSYHAFQIHKEPHQCALSFSQTHLQKAWCSRGCWQNVFSSPVFAPFFGLKDILPLWPVHNKNKLVNSLLSFESLKGIHKHIVRTISWTMMHLDFYPKPLLSSVFPSAWGGPAVTLFVSKLCSCWVPVQPRGATRSASLSASLSIALHSFLKDGNPNPYSRPQHSPPSLQSSPFPASSPGLSTFPSCSFLHHAPV